jgi:hypothetical protein
MARGGGSYDDIVKAVMAQIAKSRPDVVNAGKSVADDVSGIAAAAKSAVQSALGKPPKVTSRTARTVTPKPSRTMTKAERRAQNQQIDRERRAATADASAAKRADARAKRKEENRQKFLKEEKRNIDTTYTRRQQRVLGSKAINEDLEKKLNSLESAERVLGNRSGSFEDKLDYVLKRRVEDLLDDGYVLSKDELKSLKQATAEDIKEKAIRTKTNLTPAITNRMKKLGEFSSEELDSEGARMAFRRNLRATEKGRVPKDTRSPEQIAKDKRTNERLEELEQIKSDKARLREEGTGGGRPKKELTPEQIAENKRFYNKYYKPKQPKPKESKPASSAAEKYDKEFGKPEEFLSRSPSLGITERNAFGMTREQFAAFKAKLEKGSKAPKRK